MNVGLIGLGKMGSAIGYRLVQGGHTVYGFDPDTSMQSRARSNAIIPVSSIKQIIEHVHIIWIMVPAGKIVDSVVDELMPYLREGDIIIDGGNSNYTDSIRRATELAKHNILFLDCGTSGGLHGKELGFCLMVGGSEQAYKQVEAIFASVAAPGGYARIGSSGTGHYVKMIHNGIEYALLQAYSEGFELIHDGTFKQEHLDLETISKIWNTSSIIRSWILYLIQGIFTQDQSLDGISGCVEQTGMGAWTVENAKKNNIEIPVIKQAVEMRRRSEITGGNYATKLVALLRNAFGGHALGKK
jgi:6-phosphogluconate dehydrogenase